jgi:hypothetical protein
MSEPDPHQGDLLQPSAPPPAAAAGAPELEEVDPLFEQVQTLRALLIGTLLALLALSFGLALYLGKQMTTVSYQLETYRPEAYRTLSDFRKNADPVLRNFVGSLQNFAATNRDFGPVLDKYRLVLEPYFRPMAVVPPVMPPAAPAPQPPR